ncbi:MAG: PAS domain S-box protein [Bacteroidetes bacterium]|nr:MAG: PAS domain S-box protein [Bacteroidota bacterium]
MKSSKRKKTINRKAVAEKQNGRQISAPKKPEEKNKKTRSKTSKSIQPFPVVGIGSSAGGLEAFSSFLNNLPSNLGMAYVYVQHISATHESLLPEILERKTNMVVVKTEPEMKIEKDHVYVIPPNKVITIADGTLKLKPRPAKEMFYPIDSFFISLANSYKENAIGVLLSGTGTDGTLGLKAIKAEGGITFSQDDSAKYHDMPNHAAELGYADLIMPPEKIASQLAVFKDNLSALREWDEILNNETDMRKIEMIMHSKKNVDFSLYKKPTSHRRILRRMVLHRLKTLGDYARLLKENRTEVNALYQDLLISVTSFFRDTGVTNALTNKILPVLLKDRKINEPLRVWIPGCATGEEAVSMAIIILEYLGKKPMSSPVQIFATDLNEKAIERARAGIYLKTALQNVSPERLEKFFTKLDGHYQVIKAIREMIIYAPHNLLNDPPFSRMDLVSCQNVMIYLEGNSQSKIMQSFYYALRPTGFLILGKSESVGGASDLFEQLDKDNKIFQRKSISTPVHLDFLNRTPVPVNLKLVEERKFLESPKEIDIEKETDKVLLKKFIPASVLINKDLEILRFRGAVSKYLEPAAGKASLHLMKMIKEEMVYELRSAINDAKKQGQQVSRQGLHFNGQKDITIEVVPIKANAKDNYFLIIFQPANGEIETRPGKTITPAKRSSNERIFSLERQLREARENMKMMSEEFEATREELQSANEEVLSSNEELQSINEELETSKEELQSTNEELTTINEELQNRNVELQESYEYVESIFDTIHEPLLVLNEDLRVRDANKAFYRMFRTTPEETGGNNLFSLNNQEWDIPELKKQLKLVQSKNIEFSDFEIRHTFKSIGERAFLLNAQKLFIKDKKNALILLAIEDITEHRFSEERLRESAEKFRLLIENAFDIISILSKEGIIAYESESISKILGYSPNERIGKSVFTDPIVHPDDIKVKKEAFLKALETPAETISTEFRLQHRDGSYRDIEAVYLSLLDNPRIEGVIATYHDVTDRKKIEKQKEEFISIASHELKTPVTSVKAYAQILEDNFIQAKDKKSAELLEKMNNQVDRLTTLITDLLDFTRIQEDKLKLREEKYNINELISEVVEEMQRTTRTHKIITKLDKSVQMWGDRYRTGQVLTNLLSNAVKYSPHAKKIIVSSKIDSNLISICVEDLGIGIKKDVLNKVFDRFFRVTESKMNTFPGLGLGLYIAAEIVKRQGGTITVESTEGKGSIFCFTLPLETHDKEKKQNNVN